MQYFHLASGAMHLLSPSLCSTTIPADSAQLGYSFVNSLGCAVQNAIVTDGEIKSA
jgi:hypothetical protein